MYLNLLDTSFEFSDLKELFDIDKIIILKFINGDNIILPKRLFNDNELKEFKNNFLNIIDENKERNKLIISNYDTLEELEIGSLITSRQYRAIKKILNIKYNYLFILFLFCATVIPMAIANIFIAIDNIELVSNNIFFYLIIYLMLLYFSYKLIRRKLYPPHPNGCNDKKKTCFFYKVTINSKYLTVQYDNEKNIYDLKNLVKIIKKNSYYIAIFNVNGNQKIYS